jgi:heavy metal translocating P-type ATPase
MKKLFSEIYSFYKQSKWQVGLSLASLLAMLAHFVFSSDIPLFLIILVGGIPLGWQIILKIFKKNFGADILALIALITAVYLGEYLAANLVILMLASGQALEEYAQARASFVLQALASRISNTAHLKGGKDIAATEIKIGDLIEIYPHESCPVDGEIVEGSTVMDESYLTGEPYKISKTIGSQVISGAINGDGVVTVRAQKTPQDSRYAKIVEVLKDAQEQRPELRRLADQIGAIFAPVALLFAFATLFFTGSLTKFLSVLVVATPCPLLIAIPITIISAISIAARSGIIIKNPTVLERIPLCKTAIFDKTGTLTYGEPDLTEIIPFPGFNRSEVLQMAASLERYSRHPLASAILKLAHEENLELLAAENIAEKPGKGLVGNILGNEICVTNRKKITEVLPDFTGGLECVILVNQKIAALFHFRDSPRDDSRPFISHLSPNHGIDKVILLSGDRDLEVNYLAKLLEIKNFYASQTPEQKLEIVKNESALAPTIFMGDGINDAPALMMATVGIAFGKNNAVTSEAAGAVILENSLIKVDELIHISEQSRKIALQSAIGGMIFSVVGMGLAAAGLINPVQGALLQEIIDVVAILNALRLTWQKSIGSDVTH